jgi:hypothetical protein
MARSGKQAWEKYFKGQEVKTTVKANSKSSVKTNNLKVGGSTKKLDHGTAITVFGGDEYKAQLGVRLDDGTYGYLPLTSIQKPTEQKATYNIEAHKLIQLGKKEKRSYNGVEYDFRVFKTAEELAKSILYGLEHEPSVPDYLIEQMFEFFYENIEGDVSKINWNADIQGGDKTEIGKYIGELLPGFLILSKKTSAFSQRDFIYTTTLPEYIVPEDPSFSGVDSIFDYRNVQSDGGISPISSKYGVGAKASFWSNIMPEVLKYSDKFSKLPRTSTIKKLIDIAGNYPNVERSGRSIVFEYGMKYFLGDFVNDPGDIYKKIAADKTPVNPEVASVTRAAKSKLSTLNSSVYKETSAPVLIKNLKGGKSLTSIFSRAIADELNADDKTVMLIKELVSGKNFFQLNLDESKFKRGQIYFNVKRSSAVQITFTGSKAATNDIAAKQGTVNYLLD